MKKIILILSLLFLSSGFVYAQSGGMNLRRQAIEALDQKEYIKARYLYLQAYTALAKSGDPAVAAECAVNAAALYHRENFFKEAFDLLRGADALEGLDAASQYNIARERLRIYTKLKNTPKVTELIGNLDDLAKAAGNDSINNDLLYTKANAYYSLGLSAQGDVAFNKLVEQSKSSQNYDMVADSYRNIIAAGMRANNARMVGNTYEKFMQWNDSVAALKSADELKALQTKYEESQSIIADKDSSLSMKQYFIVGLCILAAALAGVAVLLGIMLMRALVVTRRQKKMIATAQEHNEKKTQFIHNISAQMEPTLATLDASQPGVKALTEFVGHVQELSNIESTIDQPYELEEYNINTFCEKMMQRIADRTAPDVTLSVDAPKISARINQDALTRLIGHLLDNAAEYTPAGGKISLEFKKRGPRTYQFIITDTGCGIPEENQATLFQPFAEVRDLTKGDALGLPICALMAARMNGTLTLDTSYTKGTKFILEVHPS